MFISFKNKYIPSPVDISTINEFSKLLNFVQIKSIVNAQLPFQILIETRPEVYSSDIRFRSASQSVIKSARNLVDKINVCNYKEISF